MRKEEVRELVIMFLMLAVTAVVSFTVLGRSLGTYVTGMHPVVFGLVCFILVFIINVIFHELLHALGAKAGGYKVVSMNFLGFCFEKKDKKIVFHFRGFDGLTGETKIAPTDKKDKKANLFVLYPLFGYTFEVALSIVLITVLKDSEATHGLWLIPASIIMILISSLIAIYELCPVRLENTNDGYRLRLFGKAINIEAYNEMLTIQDMQRNGKSVENVRVFEEITEYTAECNMYAMYFYLAKENYKKATEIIDVLLANTNKLDLSSSNRLVAQKLYVEILTKPLDEAKNMYEEIATSEIRRFIANDISMESIRAYILIAGMIEESEGEVKFALSKVEKAKKKALPSQIKVEEMLVEKAKEYVYKNHPKWEKETVTE